MEHRLLDNCAIQPLAQFGANGLSGALVVAIAEVALSSDIGHVPYREPARDRRVVHEIAIKYLVVSFF